MNEITEKGFKAKYDEITNKPLPIKNEQLKDLYERMMTLIKYAVDRAVYYENIRQKNASASYTLIGLTFTGLGLVTTIVTGNHWMYHPATYLLIPPLLILLIGGLSSTVIHLRDSRFKYPHDKYNEIEERWYFRKSIPNSELHLEKRGTDDAMKCAFLNDLEKEFERDADFNKKQAIIEDKETLIILYIVTAYKKKFAKRVSKYHTWSFFLAGIVMCIFVAIYFLFVMPFIP